MVVRLCVNDWWFDEDGELSGVTGDAALAIANNEIIRSKVGLGDFANGERGAVRACDICSVKAPLIGEGCGSVCEDGEGRVTLEGDCGIFWLDEDHRAAGCCAGVSADAEVFDFESGAACSVVIDDEVEGVCAGEERAGCDLERADGGEVVPGNAGADSIDEDIDSSIVGSPIS